MYDPIADPPVRRRSATPAELAARRQGYTPQRTRTTREDVGVHVTPRSALRHRPIGTQYIIPLSDGTELHVTERELAELPEDYQQAAYRVAPTEPSSKPRRQLPPRQQADEEADDDVPPARATDNLPTKRRRGARLHWLVWVGGGMLIMILGWMLLTSLSTWWVNQTNQWTYGYPRTYQVDCNVGHGTSAHPNSHFIALNLDRHVEVIEFPGDDAAHAKVYIGPVLIGAGEDLTPVTLSFEDVNGDGKPDLVIHVGDSKFIFLNTGASFQAAPNQ